mgnify:CR=1 FL=1
MSARGAHLVHGDRGFTTGGGLIARIIAPGVRGVVEDTRLLRRRRVCLVRWIASCVVSSSSR